MGKPKTEWQRTGGNKRMLILHDEGAHRGSPRQSCAKCRTGRPHGADRTHEVSEFAEVMAAIAQGAINIVCGHTTIEPGSRVHRAMERLCSLVVNGKVREV